jgi:hypothetical protein
MDATYHGLFPPNDPSVRVRPVIGGIPGPYADQPNSEVGNDITFSVNTTALVPDFGSIEYNIESLDPWGYPSESGEWSFRCDNKGPDITFTYPSGWEKEKYQVTATADDRGGSGTVTTFISGNGETFRTANIATIQVEGADNDVRAYAVDNVGNIGTMRTVDGLKLDMTPPSIAISSSPPDLDEDITGPITIEAKVLDSLSGVGSGSVMLRYGLETPSFPWAAMVPNGDHYEAEVNLSWEASQGLDLLVEVRATDVAGNMFTATFSSPIEPLNDPPEQVMEVFSDTWESRSVILYFNGTDPDGDELTYKVEYDIGEGWTDATSLMTRISATRYRMSLPDIRYEGSMGIRSIVSDGTVNVTLPERTVMVDRKAPDIQASIVPTGYWSRTMRTLSISLSDGGSGPGSSWFRKDDINLDGPVVNISSEGIHHMVAYGKDIVGNTDHLDLPEFGIDMTTPVIGNMEISPAKIGKDEDISLSFRCWDNLSGIISIVSEIVSGETRIPGTVSVHGDICTAQFTKPGLSPGKDFHIEIEIKDKAGNVLKHNSDILMIEADPDTSGINITAPETVEVGREFTIEAEHDGDISLSVRYPGMMIYWIIPESRLEGDTHSFILPGPNHGSDLAISISYMMSGTSRHYNRTLPILGASDGDGDGLDDLWESHHGLDTSVKDDVTLDKDGDGLDLIGEMVSLTDPKEDDTDGDGMPDGWESRKGTLPFRADPDEDPDGDSYTNIVEYFGDTDPRDPLSHPKDPHATPWYWLLMILLFFVFVIGFFIYQMIGKKRVEDELERVTSQDDVWDDVETG